MKKKTLALAFLSFLAPHWSHPSGFSKIGRNVPLLVRASQKELQAFIALIKIAPRYDSDETYAEMLETLVRKEIPAEQVASICFHQGMEGLFRQLVRFTKNERTKIKGSRILAGNRPLQEELIKAAQGNAGALNALMKLTGECESAAECFSILRYIERAKLTGEHIWIAYIEECQEDPRQFYIFIKGLHPGNL